MSSGITLEQIAAAIGLAAVLFVATNIDDIFILLALFSNPSFRPVQVIAGQMVGMALVIALSVAGALLALVIAPAYVGLLGLVPLALGIVKLAAAETNHELGLLDQMRGRLVAHLRLTKGLTPCWVRVGLGTRPWSNRLCSTRSFISADGV